MPIGVPDTSQGMGAPSNDQEPTPMDTPDMDGTGSKEESEIDDIFNQLDTEKQAAVIKYAKSMVNNEPEGNNNSPEMTEEQIVTEITNNILDDRNEEDRDKKEAIKNKKITNSNPFVSKNFQRKK